MSSKLKVLSVDMLTSLDVDPFKLNGDDLYKFKRRFAMKVVTNQGTFLWEVQPAYISNCGSIPWLAQKILRVKSYDLNNVLQNAAYFFHDDLYQKKGYNLLSRDDSDAMCRGILRISGYSRWQAGNIDFFLFLGAWGHWGNNEYGNADSMSSLTKIA